MKLPSLIAVVATAALAACDTSDTQTFVQPHQRPGLQPLAAAVQGPQFGEPGFSVAPANAPSGPVVDQFARNFLNTVQARSFAGRREFCGYFFVDSAGRLQATPPRRGRFASCDMPAPQKGAGIIASYHTHGAYGRGFDNEVPSVIDLTSDFDYGIDGYVSTPGGRVWLVDFQTKTAQQVCGLGCVAVDPGFVPQNENSVLQVYTTQTLRERSGRF